MNLDIFQPRILAIGAVVEALGQSEEDTLRQALAEGWHKSLSPYLDGYRFSTGGLPPPVLGRVLQCLAWGAEVPPRICEADPWGEPFRYDREELWRQAALLTPRQRERGLIRAAAVARAERSFMDSGDDFGACAARVESIFRNDREAMYRVEGITAAQVEEWSLGTASRPGARRYHPGDWPAVLAPRSDDSVEGDPLIPLDMWAFFAALLLASEEIYTTATAYELVCAEADRVRCEPPPPLAVFERRARNEFTPELRQAVWNGALAAIVKFFEERERPAPEASSERDSTWERWMSYSHAQRKLGVTRAAAVRCVRRLVEDEGLSVRAASRIVAEERGFSASSVRRWHDACQAHAPQDWAAALVPRHGGGPAKAEIHPLAWEYFKRVHLDRSKPRLAMSYRRTQEAADANGWGELPSIDTLRRRLDAEVPLYMQELIREGQPEPREEDK